MTWSAVTAMVFNNIRREQDVAKTLPLLHGMEKFTVALTREKKTDVFVCMGKGKGAGGGEA